MKLKNASEYESVQTLQTSYLQKAGKRDDEVDLYTILADPSSLSDEDYDTPLRAGVYAKWELVMSYMVLPYDIRFEISRPVYGEFDADPNQLGLDVLYQGSLKWDGCMNFEQADPKCMLHVCGPKEIENMQKMLTHVWELGPYMMGWM